MSNTTLKLNPKIEEFFKFYYDVVLIWYYLRSGEYRVDKNFVPNPNSKLIATTNFDRNEIIYYFDGKEYTEQEMISIIENYGAFI